MATTAPNTKATEPHLPTHTILGTKPKSSIAALPIAESWISEFSSAVQSVSIDKLCALIYREGFWRDMLSLTWNMRTFHTHSKILTFLSDRLAMSGMKNIQLDRSERQKEPVLNEVYEDLSWIPVFFTFETKQGKGTGIAHLVLVKDGSEERWVAYSVYTNLEEIHGHPERSLSERPETSFQYLPGAVGGGRPALTWEEMRTREQEFADSEPAVVCIGAGQSGLDIAARLKCLGIPTLVLERRARVGDGWRGRYDTLALHDPVWYDHMPYIPFPPNWPVFTPAQKLADWLESYAKSMELNVWTGVEVESCLRDDAAGIWNVAIVRSDGTKRVLKPRHVVCALGLGAGEVNMPKYPGMENFSGKVMHSTSHRTAKEYAGKKVVVLGAATSGHDVSYDCYNQGVDVTMIQRSPVYIMNARKGFATMFKGIWEEGGPPVDTGDRIYASLPTLVRKLLGTRQTAETKAFDKPLLDKLEKAGMLMHDGVDGSGVLFLAFTRGGGYYLDVGASQLVADGKIKLKSGYDIECFTNTGVKLKDGTEISADIVIFATGFGDPRPPLYKLFGESFVNSWRYRGSLNGEGEMRLFESHNEQKKNFWMFAGNLALCRFQSKHVALQIQAVELGLDLSLYYEAPV